MLFYQVLFSYGRKEFPGNWQTTLFQEICASWKQILAIDKKLSFLLKISRKSMLSSFSNAEHPWLSHFSIEFSWQYKFSWSTADLLAFHFSIQYQRSALFLKKINAMQNHWMPSMSFSLFELFGVVSGPLQLFPAFYGMFRIVPLFTSDDVTENVD